MELRTERLLLREFMMADWPIVHRYQNDPLYLRYYPFDGHSEGEVQRFVQMLIDYQHVVPRRKFQLALEHQETGALIGNCGIRRKDANDFEADIGYELDPEYWGRGLATEAARAVVRYGFEDLGLHRISSWCVADNVGSARVQEKAGLKLEGRLRHNEFYKGRWWDTLLYGLIADEWNASPSNAASL
jgi:RimJ/RimL family protein N-acetyltransferase